MNSLIRYAAGTRPRYRSLTILLIDVSCGGNSVDSKLGTVYLLKKGSIESVAWTRGEPSARREKYSSRSKA